MCLYLYATWHYRLSLVTSTCAFDFQAFVNAWKLLIGISDLFYTNRRNCNISLIIANLSSDVWLQIDLLQVSQVEGTVSWQLSRGETRNTAVGHYPSVWASHSERDIGAKRPLCEDRPWQTTDIIRSHAGLLHHVSQQVFMGFTANAKSFCGCFGMFFWTSSSKPLFGKRKTVLFHPSFKLKACVCLTLRRQTFGGNNWNLAEG